MVMSYMLRSARIKTEHTIYDNNELEEHTSAWILSTQLLI